jgi:outer membrane murein-binding lipoprotein Lpp
MNYLPFRRGLVFPALLFLAACSDGNDSAKVGKEIADDYQDSLDKAAAVEDKLQDSKEKVDAALEDAERERDD